MKINVLYFTKSIHLNVVLLWLTKVFFNSSFPPCAITVSITLHFVSYNQYCLSENPGNEKKIVLFSHIKSLMVTKDYLGFIVHHFGLNGRYAMTFSISFSFPSFWGICIICICIFHVIKHILVIEWSLHSYKSHWYVTEVLLHLLDW